jgi:hypothetical protein
LPCWFLVGPLTIAFTRAASRPRRRTGPNRPTCGASFDGRSQSGGYVAVPCPCLPRTPPGGTATIDACVARRVERGQARSRCIPTRVEQRWSRGTSRP